MTPKTSEDRKTSFFYVVHELHRLLRRRFDLVTQPHGLTMPQWRALWQLYQQDGLSQTELAGRIDTDPMTVSGLMERLEAKGLVDRRPDPRDSRVKTVLITESARQLVGDLKAQMEQAQRDAFVGISDDERQVMMQALEKLRGNLAAATHEEDEK